MAIPCGDWPAVQIYELRTSLREALLLSRPRRWTGKPSCLVLFPFCFPLRFVPSAAAMCQVTAPQRPRCH